MYLIIFLKGTFCSCIATSPTLTNFKLQSTDTVLDHSPNPCTYRLSQRKADFEHCSACCLRQDVALYVSSFSRLLCTSAPSRSRFIEFKDGRHRLLAFAVASWVRSVSELSSPTEINSTAQLLPSHYIAYCCRPSMYKHLVSYFTSATFVLASRPHLPPTAKAD